MLKQFLYDLATDKARGWPVIPIKFCLWLLSLIYGLAVRFLAFAQKLAPVRLSCRVISVGNITLGGSGKTTAVEFIAGYLKTQGRKVAILSRGYKREVRGQKSEVRGFELMGDEAFMLEKNLAGVPVIVDKDRRRGARHAIEEYAADTLILDDGFQQWKIKKDLEIVTIDATCPFGNRLMIPRGILREPLSSLKRADIFILTKTNLNPNTAGLKAQLLRVNPKALIFESVHQAMGLNRLDLPDQLLSLDYVKASKTALFCGIGDPDSFERLVRSLGADIVLTFVFADHHQYSLSDLERIIDSCLKKDIRAIITTQKDASRLEGLNFKTSGLELLVLRIKLSVTKDEQGFFNRLLQLYSL